MAEELESSLPDDIIRLAHEVLEAACDRDLQLATAESCTGGLLASLLTDIPGCSHAFERGFVVYSDAAKCDLLGVARELVKDCGAVSRDVALAMAQGGLRRSEADIAVSITGFAGPGGEDDEEGLVHLAIAVRGGEPTHREEHFGAIGREGVRLASLRTGLKMMRSAIGSYARED
ncbi:CinA family protein [Qipengyuania mesophila]|uniref:CinA family protein n=1 Tax=Erythrobacteraceae TaxID=335929 RepID=UPI00351191D7